MKHNKLLAVLSLAAVIGLTSCGGNKPTSSAKPSTPTSTVKPSTSKPSVSVAPVPAATVGEINVDKTGDKVELVITGEVENIKAEDFKMAVSLLKRDTAEGEDPVYLIGGATFADADYKYTGTIANGAYTVKVNLSDVVATDGTSAAEYDIAVAVKGVGDLEVGAESNLASKMFNIVIWETIHNIKAD